MKRVTHDKVVDYCLTQVGLNRADYERILDHPLTCACEKCRTFHSCYLPMKETIIGWEMSKVTEKGQ